MSSLNLLLGKAPGADKKIRHLIGSDTSQTYCKLNTDFWSIELKTVYDVKAFFKTIILCKKCYRQWELMNGAEKAKRPWRLFTALQKLRLYPPTKAALKKVGGAPEEFLYIDHDGTVKGYHPIVGFGIPSFTIEEMLESAWVLIKEPIVD